MLAGELGVTGVQFSRSDDATARVEEDDELEFIGGLNFFLVTSGLNFFISPGFSMASEAPQVA